MLSVYMDTNIVSGLAKRDLDETIMQDVLDVLSYVKMGKLELFTSELVEEEISLIPDEYRYYHTVIYGLVRNISLVSDRLPGNVVTSGFGGGNVITKGFGYGGKDPILQAIEDAIPIPQNNSKAPSRNLDVRHLYQCAKSQTEFFWTEDHRTILRYVDALAKAGIHVKSTEQILSQLSS